MTELTKNKEQSARKAVFLKEFGGIYHAAEVLEYKEAKSIYNIINKGLTQNSIDKINKLGYKKLVKKLKACHP